MAANLFSEQVDPELNILPYDGEAYYHGMIIPGDQADIFTEKLLESTEWRNDESMMFGKLIVTKRKVAWYGDKPYDYTYSKVTKKALPWTPTLLELKNLIEKLTNESFNSCLCNLYHDGDEGMAWHSDDERELTPKAAIGSMSFGAERKFSFKHKKTKETSSLILEHGSLLIMKGDTQINWLHRLPPTKRVKDLRINLTFRKMNGGEVIKS